MPLYRYTDDAAFYVAPTQTDVRTLKDILYRFCLATGMVTNVHKCTVATIHCAGVDLDEELAPFNIQQNGKHSLSHTTMGTLPATHR